MKTTVLRWTLGVLCAVALVYASLGVETDGIRLFGRWRVRHSVRLGAPAPEPQTTKLEQIGTPAEDPAMLALADTPMAGATEELPVVEIAMAGYVPADHVERYTDGQGDAEADLKAARKELAQARKKMKEASEKAGLPWPPKMQPNHGKEEEKPLSETAASTDINPPTTESRGASPPGTATVDNISVYAVEQELVAYTNALRIRKGLAPLIVDQKLMESARAHAAWMTSNGMRHGSSNGIWRGEIIAEGQRTARDAVNAWINSPPHYYQLTNPNHRYIGMTGYTRGGQVYWCGQFK